MTFDPYRNPNDPYRDGYRDPSPTTAAGILFGALLFAVIIGFMYFFGNNEQNVAMNDMRPPITQPPTTGAANMQPAPAPKIKPAE